MYIFDGAMGTMIQSAGLEEVYCQELFNIESKGVEKLTPDNFNTFLLDENEEVRKEAYR